RHRADSMGWRQAERLWKDPRPHGVAGNGFAASCSCQPLRIHSGSMVVSLHPSRRKAFSRVRGLLHNRFDSQDRETPDTNDSPAHGKTTLGGETAQKKHNSISTDNHFLLRLLCLFAADPVFAI